MLHNKHVSILNRELIFHTRRSYAFIVDTRKGAKTEVQQQQSHYEWHQQQEQHCCFCRKCKIGLSECVVDEIPTIGTFLSSNDCGLHQTWD